MKEKANMKLLQNLDVCLEHMGCGPFEEVVIDVLLDLSMLQKFDKKGLYYVLDGIPEDLSKCSQIF